MFLSDHEGGREREAGRFGRLHPEVESALDLEVPVFAFEFDAEALVARRAREHRPVPKFPRVRRDLAIVVDRAVSAGEVESACGTPWATS